MQAFVIVCSSIHDFYGKPNETEGFIVAKYLQSTTRFFPDFFDLFRYLMQSADDGFWWLTHFKQTNLFLEELLPFPFMLFLIYCICSKFYRISCLSLAFLMID
jgi:hypothetical protein